MHRLSSQVVGHVSSFLDLADVKHLAGVSQSLRAACRWALLGAHKRAGTWIVFRNANLYAIYGDLSLFQELLEAELQVALREAKSYTTLRRPWWFPTADLAQNYAFHFMQECLRYGNMKAMERLLLTFDPVSREKFREMERITDRDGLVEWQTIADAAALSVRGRAVLDELIADGWNTSVQALCNAVSVGDVRLVKWLLYEKNVYQDLKYAQYDRILMCRDQTCVLTLFRYLGRKKEMHFYMYDLECAIRYGQTRLLKWLVRTGAIRDLINEIPTMRFTDSCCRSPYHNEETLRYMETLDCELGREIREWRETRKGACTSSKES